MNRYVARRWARLLALSVMVLLSARVAAVAEPVTGGGPGFAGSTPGSSWKYDVEILRSTDQYRAGVPQFRDALYGDDQGQLWLRVQLHFSGGSDFYYPCFEERILTSADQGLTWRFAEGVWPGPRDTRSVLADGTILETGSYCFVNWDRWERYPIAEMNRLKAQGYYVNEKGAASGFCSLIYDLWFRRSTDGGKTWIEKPIHKQLPFFAYIASRHYQRLLDNGTVIAFFSGRPTAEGPRSAYAVRSGDAGETWELVTVADGKLSHLPEGFHETFPIVRPDGRMLALVRTHLGDFAYLTRSEDGGKTWSTLQKSPIIAKHPVPTLLRDGTIIVTYPRRFAKPFGIRARFTADMGRTWSEEVVIRDDFEIANGLAHPMTVQLPDGTLFTVLQGDRYTDDGTIRHVVLGTRWTRGYRLPHGPKMPTPPRRAKFNHDRKQKSPWECARELGHGPMFLYREKASVR